MSVWYKILLITLLLIVFQFFLPTSGISFLGLEEVELGEPIEAAGTEESLPAAATKNELYFVGDIMLARDVERRMKNSGATFPFAGFSISSTSYAVANFESAIPEIHVPTPNNTFRFSSPRNSLKAVKEAGFTHLGLANNHTFDYGLAGYNQTVSSVWDNGLVPFGHPSVVALPSYTVVEVNDESIGIIALHTLYSEPTREALAAVLETMEDESDLQVAYVHWGEEYVDRPSRAQRNFAKILAELGIDIIVGHHPHVIQSVEMVDDTLVFYSLGNFIFDQYFSEAVQQGLVLKLLLGAEKYLEIMPVSSLETRNQPHEMSPENKAKLLDYLASISDESLRENILKGRLPLSFWLASSPEVVIMAE